MVPEVNLNPAAVGPAAAGSSAASTSAAPTPSAAASTGRGLVYNVEENKCVDVYIRVKLPQEGRGALRVFTGIRREHMGNFIYSVEPVKRSEVTIASGACWIYGNVALQRCGTRPGYFLYRGALPLGTIVHISYEAEGGDSFSAFFRVEKRRRRRGEVKTTYGKVVRLTVQNLAPLPSLTPEEYIRSVNRIAELGAPGKWPVVQLYHYWMGGGQ